MLTMDNQMLRNTTFILFLLGCLTVVGCSKAPEASQVVQDNSAPSADTKALTLEVYKSPTCGCCEDWVTHMQTNGIGATVQHPEDLNAIKEKFGIAPQYQSCHTGVSSDGYVFEGHVPARLIKQFLQEKPVDAIGLAVPGMPIGSPGMEMDDRITPYDVLLLHKNGNVSVYAHVDAQEK